VNPRLLPKLVHTLTMAIVADRDKCLNRDLGRFPD
jgi:hypothetical protein